MIRLGDVSFGLGADTTGLRNSIRDLQRYGNVVDQVSASTAQGSAQIASAMRRQEKAATDALNATLRMSQGFQKLKGGEQFAQQATRNFQQLNSTLTSGSLSVLQYQRAMERFKASTQSTTREFKAFNASLDKGKMEGFTAALQNLSSGVVFIQGPLGGLATRISSLVQLMKQGGFQVLAFIGGIAAGGLAVYEFGNTILQAGKKMNAWMGQFESVTGSIFAAQNQMREITKIARQSGQSIDVLAPAFARFTIAAEGTALTGKDVSEAFTVVASAATKLQLNVEQSEGIFRALEQMMSKGTVQAEELRGQLGDRLAGAVQIAARAMGVTTVKLQQMMKAGELITSGFLPKFIDELAKTLHIDGKPIDNYTAAVNNNATAWFQLRAELDKQLQVTNKVMELYKQMTRLLDYIRKNLEDVKTVALAVGGALLGMVAPAIISGIWALTKGIVTLTFKMGVLNKVMNVSLIGGFLRLVIILGTVTAAIYSQRDKIQGLGGDYVTLGDNIEALTNRLNNNNNAWVKFAKSDPFRPFQDAAEKFFSDLWNSSNTGWIKFKAITYSALNDMLGFFSNINESVITMFKALPEIVGEAVINAVNLMLRGLAAALTWMSQKFADFKNEILGFQDGVVKDALGWLGDKIGKAFDLGDIGTQFTQQAKGIVYTAQEIPNAYQGAWFEAIREIDRLMQQHKDILGDTRKEFEKLLEESRTLASVNIVTRVRKSMYEDFPLGVNGKGEKKTAKEVTELTEKQIKALNRKAEAMKNIQEAIDRTNETIDALGGTTANLNELTDRFKREKEVEKYAKALRKAGADTEYITLKTKELNAALEKKDLLTKQREALIEFRDSFADAFDTIGASIVDGLTEGKNALESFRSVSKAIVKDLIQTFLKLAVMNPIKNAIFGTDEPTLQGGFLGNLKKAMPGIFKQAAAGPLISAVDKWQGVRSGNENYNNIGSALPAVGQGIRGSRMGKIGLPGFDAMAAAIRRKESGSFAGNYNALGPVIPKTGDRAYGAYQMMGNNIPSWSKKALGTSMTGPQLLGDQGSQDAIFKKIFGGYLQKYGPTGASQAWFGGEGSVGRSGRMDPLGTTVAKYAKDFNDNVKLATTNVKDMAKTVPEVTKALPVMTKGFTDVGTTLSSIKPPPITANAGGGGGGFLGGIGGWLKGLFGGGSAAGIAAAAAGGPFTGLFAKGSAFGSSGIISSPTNFTYGGGGLGKAGEDGEEAIMPLTRDSSGNLGIATTASRSGGGDVIVNIYAPDGSKTDVKKTTNDNGDSIIDVIVQSVKSSMTTDIAKGGTSINKAMEGRYNLKASSGLK